MVSTATSSISLPNQPTSTLDTMPIGHLYWYALSFLLCGLYSHSHFHAWPEQGYGPHRVSKHPRIPFTIKDQLILTLEPTGLPQQVARRPERQIRRRRAKGHRGR